VVSDSVRRTRTRRWLCLIVAAGFLLRLTAWKWGQAYAYFGQNDAIEAYSVAVNYWNGEERAQYIGQPNFNPKSKLPGPLWTLFCYWPLRLTGSMEGVMAAMTLLNTAAIILVYFLAERAFGFQVALWASGIFAVLPAAVFYSTDVYNPDVMPFLGAALSLALWQTIQRDHSRWIAIVCALFLTMPQFHMSGLTLGPAIILILWLAGVRLSVPWLLAGIVAGLVCYLPYLQGETSHGWQNTRAMFSGAQVRSWDSLKALIAPFNLLVNWVPQWTRTFGEYRDLGSACFGSFWVLAAFNVISAVSVLALIATAGTSAVRAFRGFLGEPRRTFAKSKGVLFMATLLMAPLLCGLIGGGPFHARYALVLLSPLVCLAGWAVQQLVGFKSGARPSPGPATAEASAAAGSSSRIEPGVAAPGDGRPPKTSWIYGTALAATLVTIGFNAVFMPAMFFQRGRMIDQASAFVPSFRNIDRVYKVLQQHAGAGRPFQIDPGPYMASLKPRDEVRSGALLLAAYVAIRQQDPGASSGCHGRPVVYQLRTADQVRSGDPSVAYVGHGIALVERLRRPRGFRNRTSRIQTNPEALASLDVPTW
jgi:hypothetical protein